MLPGPGETVPVLPGGAANVLAWQNGAANTTSGGLSGNVDLQIAPALGRKDGGFMKAAYEYNELGSLGAPASFTTIQL